MLACDHVPCCSLRSRCRRWSMAIEAGSISETQEESICHHRWCAVLCAVRLCTDHCALSRALSRCPQCSLVPLFSPWLLPLLRRLSLSPSLLLQLASCSCLVS